jgi:hypothetical protein
MLSHTMKNQIAVVFLLMLLLAALLAMASSAVACPPDMYNNSLHHCVPRPDDCAHQKPGELPVTAICNDGTCSHSQHRAGTCSSHHGVEHFTPAAQL